MKYLARVSATLLLCLSPLLLPAENSSVSPQSGAAVAGRPEMMDVSELRPGMKGYGLTVYSGTKPEKFGVEILGVRKNTLADGDMIIVRVDHPIMEGIGGIAGMSGSPIFIDDKLVGAFAYGWGFSVRPIGGVTPIKSMMKVLDLVTEESKIPPEDELPNSIAWPEAAEALSRSIPRLPDVNIPEMELAAMGVTGLSNPSGNAVFQPLAVPLMVSTSSPRVMAQVEKMFANTGLQPVMAGMAAGGGMGDRRGDPQFADLKAENGGAISVVLCEGDLNLAGLGTTTYVEGDRLIAFGHPMYGMGDVDAPIAVSEVITVIPSLMRPFKLGNAVKTIGALRQDRLPAVGGTLSRQSPMVPLRIGLKAPETGVDRDFNFRLWNNRQFLPMLTMVCYMEAMESARLEGTMTLTLKYRIRLEDGREVVQAQYQSGSDFVAMMTAFPMMQDLYNILNNRFEPVRLKDVQVDIEIGNRQQLSVMNRLIQNQQRLRPGSTFRTKLHIDHWRREKTELPLSVELPKDLKPGSYQVVITDGLGRLQLESQFNPKLNRVESLDDLLRRSEPSFPDNAIHVLLIDPSDRVTLNGMPIDAMPKSIASVTRSTLRDQRQAGSSRGILLSEKVIPWDGMIVGGVSHTINVEALER